MKDALITKENVLSQVDIKINQSDLVDVVVSEKEQIMLAEKAHIRKELSSLSKEYKKVNDDIQAKKIKEASAKYGKTLKKLSDAFIELGQNKTFHFSINNSGYSSSKIEIGNDRYRISVLDNNGGTYFSNILIEKSKELLKLEDRLEELNNNVLELRDQEYQIQEKLNNIERYARQAKASITKELVKNMDIKFPQLGE